MSSIVKRNRKYASTSIIAKNKNIEQLLLPKAFIIKIEDTIPKQLYKHLLDQNTSNSTQTQSKAHTEISAWYTSNREHCVLYLQKLCSTYGLRDNTFFSALSYADRLMRNSNKLPTKDYDLKIISCLLLASKYVENEAYEFDLNDIASYANDSIFNITDVKKYEVKCLRDLQYELNESTSYDFLMCQLACGVIYKDELKDKSEVNVFANYAKNLLMQTAKTHLSLLYKPETIALSIIHYTRLHFNCQSQRINQIKAKLQFNDKEFDACGDYLTSITRQIQKKKSIKAHNKPKNKAATQTQWINNISSSSTQPNSTSSLVQVQEQAQVQVPVQAHVPIKQCKNRSKSIYGTARLSGNGIKLNTAYAAKAFLPKIRDH